jgi:hypothetical protein
MFKLSTYFVAGLLVLVPTALRAQGAASTGSIAGSADPGAQIIVTGTDSGTVIGVVADCDGKYKAENLKPGRYAIVEGGAHHATRKLSVNAGAVSEVDLGSATPESTRACIEKKK